MARLASYEEQAEAIVVGENDDPVHRLLVPGYRFGPTVDGLHPVAEAEVLQVGPRQHPAVGSKV